MARYEFVTRWHLDAPIESVWEPIFHVERWPDWWNGVKEVQLLAAGGPDGVGALWRYTWESALPYELAFDMRVTDVRAPVMLRGIASGELAGEGLWSLYRSERGTFVRYDWNVCTTSAWMNALAPLARPAFAWNHDVVMRQGGEGLARLLAMSAR
jgi:hypothetical protein